MKKQKKTGDENKISENQEKIIYAHLKLVVSIARKYYKNEKVESNFGLFDLIQEGNIGLIQAIKNFDYKKWNKFSTYAVWKIEAKIKRIIKEKLNIIHIPSYIIEEIYRINKYLEKLNENEKENVYKDSYMREKLKMIKNTNPISLETPNKTDGKGCLKDHILDKKQSDVVQKITEEEFKKYLKQKISKANLNSRDKEILEDLFGLNDGIKKTLREIWEKYNFSWQYIHIIKEKFLNEIKQSLKFKELYNDCFGKKFKEKK